LYNPSTRTWSRTGSLGTARALATATVLADGRVLVVGGFDGTQSLSSTEVYNPDTGAFTSTSSLLQARYYHSATLITGTNSLIDGDVLVVGGFDGRADLTGAELYNPDNGTWSAAGDMAESRESHTATLLQTGDVLVAGGYDNNLGANLASAELYDPYTGEWAPTGAMATARSKHTATAVGDGRVLIAGGYSSTGPSLYTTEIYDPQTSQFSPGANLNAARGGHIAATLPDGRVFVAGGLTAGSTAGVALDSAEVYQLPSNGTSGPSVTPTNTAIPPTPTATITPPVATTLYVTDYPDSTTAGQAHLLTVAAYDQDGNLATGYAGTIRLTSSDPQAIFSAPATLTDGTGTFTITLATSGTQIITATDIMSAALAGNEDGIVVQPSTAISLAVSGFSNPTTSGQAAPFSITLRDAYGNVATGYTGTVHLASSDGQAVLPVDYTFMPDDAGTHVFTATLVTVGTQSITATDTMSGALTGAQGGIVVNVSAAQQTQTAVAVNTATETATTTPTMTSTNTSAASATATSIGTTESSSTPPATLIPSPTSTTIATLMGTSTATNTGTAQAADTATSTVMATASSSPIVTSTGTSVATIPGTSTMAATPPDTSTPTATQTNTATNTPSSTSTPSATATTAPTEASTATTAPTTTPYPTAATPPLPETATPQPISPGCAVSFVQVRAQPQPLSRPALAVNGLRNVSRERSPATSRTSLFFSDGRLVGFYSSKSYQSLACGRYTLIDVRGVIAWGATDLPGKRHINLLGDIFRVRVTRDRVRDLHPLTFSVRVDIPRLRFDRTYRGLRGSVDMQR